jgi:small multidrug resistance pump
MHWLFLALAIVLEVGGTTSMKLSEGFARLGPSVAVVVCYLASVAMLTLALRRIDVSVAYAIWSGVGIALITAIGIGWFREPVSFGKLAAIGLIVVGVVVLNINGGTH